MKKQKLKFTGTLEDLTDILWDHDIYGSMSERPGFHRFVSSNGGCLHWYANGTICFQGPAFARQELEEKLEGMFDGSDQGAPADRVEPELVYTTPPPPDLTDLMSCGDCGVQPGQVHKEGCDIEMCSVCGGQRRMCCCDGHDKAFAHWTGFWPGTPEAEMLGIETNELFRRGLHRIFFIKPKMDSSRIG